MCLLGADRGRVLIDGRPAAQMTAGERARLLSYLPQGQDVHWPLSVERLVALGRLPHLAPFSRLDEADREAVHRAMAAADVLHLTGRRSEEHTSELQSLMRISYAVFCLQKKHANTTITNDTKHL